MSEASEDVEMLPSCSSVSAGCLCPEGSGKAVQKQNSSDISCDVEYSCSNCRKQSGCPKDSIREVGHINLSADLISKKSDLRPKDKVSANSSPKVMSSCCHSQIDTPPSENLNLKNLVGDPIYDRQGKLPECAVAASEGVIGQSAAKNCDNLLEDRANTNSLDGGSSDILIKNYPKVASETDKSSRASSEEAFKCPDRNKQRGKLIESVECLDMQPALQSASEHENDESEIMEHDVKVCDICGDAGREDLLAICSRCSDGAEHTYCMRETLDKVPECDWLCEECKFPEGTENQRQDKFEMVGRNEIIQTPECPSFVHNYPFVKLDGEDADVEVNRTSSSDLEVDRSGKVNKNSQVTGKRRLDSSEIALVAKRQVLETTIGSPKASSPCRTAAVSRDWSFKSLDKGKVKPSHNLSSAARAIDSVPKAARSSTARQHQTRRGTLLKSNSFSASTLQSKVKPVDEALSRKQKGAREPAKTLDVKEGPVTLIGKSKSFIPANLGRPNATEAKVKMLSPKASHVQELKFKQAKERSSLEKKNSFRLDQSSSTFCTSPSTLKADEKPASRCEANLRNNGDLKAVHSDGKLTSSSKPNTHLTRKVGASSTNGACRSAEQKPHQVSLRDETSTSSSLSAERTFNVSGVSQDGLPQSHESTNQDETMRNNSVVRSRQSVTTGRNSPPPCQKGKEIPHAAQLSTSSSPRALAVGVSEARSSVEQMGNRSRLKAAIEAAMLKKPGIYKKRLADPSDEFSVSSTDVNCEAVSQELSLVSSYLRNPISGEGVHGGQAVLQSCSSDFRKQPVDNVKQPMMHPLESGFSSKAGDFESNTLSDGGACLKELCSHDSAALSVPSKISVIPEQEYIWQGDFEVHRSGKLADLCNGIQAHLSTWASSKVLETVQKLPSKFSLNEVDRASIWPTQFHNNGAKDDNIALYLFAKDLESYERNYKRLLESMIKNDLALKGNIDGIELLIFPSNQLPEKSQRWNMLFFLWGVFRGKRVSCLDETHGSLKKLHNHNLNAVRQCGSTPAAVMSMPESLCTLQHLERGPSAFDRPCSVSLASSPFAEVKLPVTSSSETINGNCHTKISAIDETHMNLQENIGFEDRAIDLQSLPRIPTSIVSLCQEMRYSTNSLKGQTDSDSGPDKDHQCSARVTGTSRSVSEEKILDRGGNEVKQERSLTEGEESIKTELEEEEGLLETDAADGRCALTGAFSITDPDVLQFNVKKCRYPVFVEAAPQSSTGIRQTLPWNDTNCTLVDGGRVSKKLKTGLGETYGSNGSSCASSLGGLFASPLVENIHDKDKSPETCDDNPEKSVTSEMHFFPVDSCAPWNLQPSAEEDRHLDGTPNLELALGAETKPAEQGILPFFVGMVDKKNKAIKEDMEDATASLSLSLAFPFSDKERTAKPVSKTEQLLPERHRVNTSLLLFGGFQDG